MNRREFLKTSGKAGLGGLALLALGGCTAGYIIDKLSEENNKPFFDGFVCNYIEDRDHSGEAGDSEKDFVGKNQPLFYASEGLTLSCIIENYEGSNLKVEVEDENGEIILRNSLEVEENKKAIYGWEILAKQIHESRGDHEYTVKWYIDGFPIERNQFILKE